MNNHNPLTATGQYFTPPSKYEILKRLINQWLDTDKESIDKLICGSPEYHEVIGGIAAYETVLKDIEQLEAEVTT